MLEAWPPRGGEPAAPGPHTVLVALLQVRSARGTHGLRTAARGVAAGGVLLALACALYAAAAVDGVALAVLLHDIRRVPNSARS
ncbi:hypothetical protein [Micromonospora sp. NPDC047730]|uniref:hypothetical protein n=1 Tax=Micromonospora sp. NPDC047730 TaxID=3364253 RepID=UPI0037196B55